MILTIKKLRSLIRERLIHSPTLGWYTPGVQPANSERASFIGEPIKIRARGGKSSPHGEGNWSSDSDEFLAIAQNIVKKAHELSNLGVDTDAEKVTQMANDIYKNTLEKQISTRSNTTDWLPYYNALFNTAKRFASSVIFLSDSIVEETKDDVDPKIKRAVTSFSRACKEFNKVYIENKRAFDSRNNQSQ